MNNQIEQVLIGSILGDGSINKHGAYQESHCAKQKDYLFWKRRILKKEFKMRMYYVITNKENWTKQNQYRLSSQVSSILKEYREMCYPNGKKTITNEFIKRIGKLAVCIWYFDDGSYNAWKNAVDIHSLCFSYEENRMLQRMLKNRFGLHFRIGCLHSRKTDYPYFLRCAGENTDNFLAFIKENAIYIPKSMTYKMGKFHRGNMKWIEEKRKALQNQRHNYRQTNKEQLKKIDHEYYIKNRTRIRKQVAEYYQNNKDKWEIYTKRRREHPEKLKEMFHKYYVKNKERIRIRSHKYHLKNKEKIHKAKLERLKNGLCIYCGRKNNSKDFQYSCVECRNKRNIKDRTKRMEQKIKRYCCTSWHGNKD